MKTISKALIAVMVAAAMCLVPVFAIADDSEAAATLKDGSSGVSFKGSMSNDEFDKLISDDYKMELAYMALNSVIGSDGDGAFTITDLTITDVENLKLSKGTKIDGDKITTVYAQSITCNIKFTATYALPSGPFYTAGTLFSLTDGNQTLFRELGGNTLANGDVLKFDGTNVSHLAFAPCILQQSN